MSTIKNKHEKYLKLESRIFASTSPKKSFSKRLNCLKRYERQLMTAGLISTSFLIPAGDLSAQLDPASTGDEIIVNETAPNKQERSDIAVADNGDFVVVWEQDDFTFVRVFGRLYNADGTPKSNEFPISNLSTNINNTTPSVAMDSNGDFIVAWEQYSLISSTSYSILAQKYSASGASSGSLISINSTIEMNRPDVALAESGSFVITWHSGLSTTSIQGRRYDASGSSYGLVSVSNPFTLEQKHSSIGMDAGGDFIIVWSEQNGTYFKITGQKFSPIGASGSVFDIHSTGIDNFIRPEIDMDEDGRFAVAFQVASKGASVWARSYDVNCNPVGSTFEVNPSTTLSQSRPAVAMLEEGKFIITWQERTFAVAPPIRGENINTRDASGSGILAQVFDAAGDPEGDLREVNTTTNSDQSRPVVGTDENGNFTIAWQSYGQDGDDYGVITRQLTSVAAPIPTLSQWGIMILGLFVSIFGLIGIKNKKKTPIKVRS